MVTGYTATGTALLVAFYHPETSTASAGEPRSGSPDRHGPSASTMQPFLRVHGAATRFCLLYMDDFAGLMVPRPPHIDGLLYAERALAWTLIIDSGHIPLANDVRYLQQRSLQTPTPEFPHVGTDRGSSSGISTTFGRSSRRNKG